MVTSEPVHNKTEKFENTFFCLLRSYFSNILLVFLCLAELFYRDIPWVLTIIFFSGLNEWSIIFAVV